MRLVRDIDDEGIYYYWEDLEDTAVSPRLPCMVIAKEWRDKYMFSKYRGRERRRSHIDRRLNMAKRKETDALLFVSRHKPQGRRVTDKPVYLAEDLVTDKLKCYC